MEGRSERKWRTLRQISSPQEESELVVGEMILEAEIGEVEGLPEDEPVFTQVDEIEGIDAAKERVLVVLPVGATTRLVRETLENFTGAEVATTPDALRGFELALQKSFHLFIFGMQVGELSGPMLYELISKAYTTGHGPRRLAPGVVFIREKEDPKLPEELKRDARVKDVVSKPIRIDRLLSAVKGSLKVLDPTAR